jgi:hypothetical protein
MTENVITAELVDGQSIDLAIDALINTHNVANNHIDHSGVSVIAGTGLSGGGTIAATRTINCDITQYTDALARTAVVDDGIYPTGWDADTTHAPSRNAVRDKIVLIDSDISGKTDQADVEDIITAELVNGQSIDNAIDALISTHNVADNHIAHSGVTITAGTGLSGGGTIAATRTINCDITQYSDALAKVACVSDVAYAGTWNGVTTIAPSKNATYDKFVLVSSEIDSDISTHAGLPSVHHTKYTNSEAVAAVVAQNPLALTNAIKIGGNSIEDSTGAEMIGFNGAGFIDFLAGQGTPVDNDVLAWDTSGSKWIVQAQIGGGAGGDWFKTITGITNDVVADATDDTLTLASGNNILGIVGTAVTDTITFTINQANISHDSIGGVSVDDHHPQAHTLASHSSKAHSELTGIGANDHHGQPSDVAYSSAWNGVTIAPSKNAVYDEMETRLKKVHTIVQLPYAWSRDAGTTLLMDNGTNTGWYASGAGAGGYYYWAVNLPPLIVGQTVEEVRVAIYDDIAGAGRYFNLVKYHYGTTTNIDTTPSVWGSENAWTTPGFTTDFVVASYTRYAVGIKEAIGDPIRIQSIQVVYK